MGGFGYDFGLDPQTEESSRFFDLYSRLGNSPAFNYSEELDPKDPELLNYQRLATTPTGSESMISDYVNSRPDYNEYKPGLGRKLASFGIGALSGDPAKAYAVSRQILNDPYERSLKDWQGEGSNIASRARLMDAERQRELTAAKYGLQNKVGDIRARERNRKAGEASSRAVAARIMAEEQKNRDDIERKREFDTRQALSQNIFDATQTQRKFMDDLSREREDRLAQESSDRAATRSASEKDIGKQNKRLADYASTRGIDAGEYGSALDIAKELALQEAKKNRAWADIIQENTSGDTRYSISQDSKHSERVRLLNMYLNNLSSKYMRGEF